jgi:selenocysteine lyase/cysteine desulfurase
MEHMAALIDSDTKVVAVSAASNLLGSKSPLDEIGKLANEVGAYYVIDAVHHIAHGPLDVQALDCDFLAFSGYKLFSSHGSFLYGKEEYLESLSPYKVEPAPEHGPRKWESGMRNPAIFSALCGAVDHFVWLADQIQQQYTGKFIDYEGRKRALKIAMDATEQYEMDLSKAVLEGFDDVPGLLDIPKVNVYGLTDLKRLNERDPTFSFLVDGIPDNEVVKRLWTEGAIALRASSFYSYSAENVYNKPAMIRLSLVQYNTIEEIRDFLQTLNTICES